MSTAHVAVPRSDGLGAERPASEEQDISEAGESPFEYMAEEALVPVASSVHKYAGGLRFAGDDDEDPLPASAFGDDLEDLELEPPPLMERGVRNHDLSIGSTSGAKRYAKNSELGILDRIAALESDRAQSRGGRRSATEALVRRRHYYEFADDQPIRVRVLDVDALPLEEIHRAFAFTLVRRLPAELCVRVASRIALFRDNFGQQQYENLIRDCGFIFGPTHGPELLALFARCHATISVPFLLDYTRRYGTFSRKFLAAQVEKSLQPKFFDFIRYQEKGGVKPLPPIVSRPWALSSYTRLMVRSQLKSQLHEQLKLHGQIPETKLKADTADDLPVEARAAERLSAAGSLRVPGPTTTQEMRKQHKKKWKPSEADARRPELLDAIMEAEYSGRGWNPADAENVRAALKTDRLRARQIAASVAAPGSDAAVAATTTGGAAGREVFAGDRHPDADDDELDELLGPPPDAGSGSSGGVGSSRGAGGGRRRQPIVEDLDGNGEEELDRAAAASSARFKMQFEHVVPDGALGASDALAELGAAGADDGSAGQRPDHLEVIDLPFRFWNRQRRPFFRHMKKAYQLVEGEWRQVADPRGPRFEPKRRHRPRHEVKEQRLRYKMRNEGVSAPPPQRESWP